MFNDPEHKKYREYLGLGAEIAVAFSVPILVGYWADSQFGTFPWMLITGILFGIIFMFVIFSKVIRDVNKKD